LFVLQEELEKARASARRFEAELGETKRQLTDAKKEVVKQQALVKQLLEQDCACEERGEQEGPDGGGVSAQEDEEGRSYRWECSWSCGIDREKRVTRENAVPRDRADVVECAAHPSKGQSQAYKDENNKKWRQVLNQYLR